ncbi:MAG: hypothetical protein JWM86_1859, partial [Thermoleophilia bacterium]|nr:hypothetical protein [Thermoleophilia bacterium]
MGFGKRLIAVLGGAAVLCGPWSGAAFAHEGHPHDLVLPEALQRCDRVEVLEDIGRGCEVGDVLRVESPGQAPVFIHETVDAAPEDGSGTIEPVADPDSVKCSQAGQFRYRVIYANPSDMPNRMATVQGQLRDVTLQAATHVRNRTVELEPGLVQRLRIACDPVGQVQVEHVQLDEPRSAITFTSISLKVRSAIAMGPNDNAVIYVDGQVGGAAGMGNLGSFRGGYVAQVYAPYFEWNVALHEMFHNMGAVSNAAPNTTGASHC